MEGDWRSKGLISMILEHARSLWSVRFRPNSVCFCLFFSSGVEPLPARQFIGTPRRHSDTVGPGVRHIGIPSRRCVFSRRPIWLPNSQLFWKELIVTNYMMIACWSRPYYAFLRDTCTLCRIYLPDTEHKQNLATMERMDERHVALLRRHRDTFVKSVDVELLFPLLNEIIFTREIAEMKQLPSSHARVEKLLDILPAKGRAAFTYLCLALEKTYPHLLTVMCIGRDRELTGKSVKNDENNLITWWNCTSNSWWHVCFKGRSSRSCYHYHIVEKDFNIMPMFDALLIEMRDVIVFFLRVIYFV